MSTPYIYPGIKHHAFGQVDSTTGALLNGMNVLNVIKNFTGNFTIILASPIPSAERHISISLRSGNVGLIGAFEVEGSNSSFDVLILAGGVPADLDFEFLVQRVNFAQELTLGGGLSGGLGGLGEG